MLAIAYWHRPVPGMRPLELRDERGVMAVLFAVVLTILLIMTAAVWDIGNWWTHRKHLQTKADAAAFAGGALGLPVRNRHRRQDRRRGPEIRRPHRGPGNQDFTGGTTFNPQIGGTPGDDIHVVLNGADWWDDDAGLDPPDGNVDLRSDELLDVKATEETTHRSSA